MKFQWNEETLKSTLTKKMISSKEIIENPDTFMRDGANITFAVCNILKEVMLLEETKMKVGKMLDMDRPENPVDEKYTTRRHGNADRPNFNSIEDELDYLSSVVSMIKALREIEKAEKIVKLKDYSDGVNTLVNDYLRQCVTEKINLLENRS